MKSKERKEEIIDFFVSQGPWSITRECAVECAITTITCLIETRILQPKGSVEYTRSEMIEILALLNKEKNEGSSKNTASTNPPKL